MSSTTASDGSAAAVQPAMEPALGSTYVDTSTSRLKLILGVVVVVVVVAGSAAYYLSSRPRGSARAPIVDGTGHSSIAGETFGLEKYPGARPVPAFGDSTDSIVASFETNDTPDQVMGYYRVRFPVCQISASETGSVLTAGMNGREVRVRADSVGSGSKVQVSISR